MRIVALHGGRETIVLSRIYFFTVTACLVVAALGAHAAKSKASLALWYEKPATKWVEALPVGNGYMGAMVFGGVDKERIQFNEGTLWQGHPQDYSHVGAAESLAEIRRLLFEGDQRRAQALAMDKFMSVPLRQMPYQPFGDLHLEFNLGANCSDYMRTLDLASATAITEFSVGEKHYRREVFASYPDRVVVVRLTASQPGSVSFKAWLTSPHTKIESLALDQTTLALRGQPADCVFEKSGEPPVGSVLRFEARLQAIIAKGSIQAEGNVLKVENADSVTLLLAAATSYVDFEETDGDPVAACGNTIAAAMTKAPADLYRAHLGDYQSLFRRVSFELDGTSPDVPTDERIRRCAQTPDVGLEALLFHFGRYLLIACSRAGGQPANLQGIWNDELAPPWDCKYTININTEMNYWPAEPANLAECTAPLFDALDEVAQSGTRVAKAHYGCRGWVCHHNFDLWRGTAPINHSDHGLWPMGGAWLCQNLWWRYEFSGDHTFLAERAYPLIKGAALFFTDYLVEDPRNKSRWLISGPSNSPEQGGLVMGPTMDHQIIRDLLANAITAAKVLGVDEDLQTQWGNIRTRIAPNQIGHYGQLQEWLEDKDDPKNEHRHVSHLWGLCPGSEINENTPELLDAARRSLIFRGDGGTGWSMAWKVNLWARLGDGDHAHLMLGRMLNLVEGVGKEYEHGGVYPNLFDAHPPFQIDGNLGACAGIIEMLLQSHVGYIHLLPALPSAWRSGRITGLRARGGYEIDIAWADAKLTSARILSVNGGTTELRYGDERLPVTLGEGGVFRWEER